MSNRVPFPFSAGFAARLILVSASTHSRPQTQYSIFKEFICKRSTEAGQSYKGHVSNVLKVKDSPSHTQVQDIEYLFYRNKETKKVNAKHFIFRHI